MKDTVYIHTRRRYYFNVIFIVRLAEPGSVNGYDLLTTLASYVRVVFFKV